MVSRGRHGCFRSAAAFFSFCGRGGRRGEGELLVVSFCVFFSAGGGAGGEGGGGHVDVMVNAAKA